MPITDSTRPPRVLFASNGHGEDAIACGVIDRIQRSGATVEIAGWPMVGRGDAYRSRAIAIAGTPNTLPSEGFGTLSARLFWGDVRAGWIRTHWRQIAAARALRGRFDLIVAVGDIVPVAAATLARTRCVLIGCAKSAYYGAGWGYSPFELTWLRRSCALTFPRDALTARQLEGAAVPQRFVGNPMMDDLAPSGDPFGISVSEVVVVCLPGSRSDAHANAKAMMALLPTARAIAPGRTVTHLFAVGDGFDRSSLGTVPARIDDDTSVMVVQGRSAFANALHRANVVLGAAGTANEQAIGLEKPLAVFPTEGPQGEAYVRMKMRFFGPAAVVAPRERSALADCLRALLSDNERRERMRRAGIERMGGPGASDAICDIILEMVGARAPAAPAPTDRLVRSDV
jgi:uncharacterized protein (TIGR03492 family)